MLQVTCETFVSISAIADHLSGEPEHCAEFFNDFYIDGFPAWDTEGEFEETLDDDGREAIKRLAELAGFTVTEKETGAE